VIPLGEFRLTPESQDASWASDKPSPNFSTHLAHLATLEYTLDRNAVMLVLENLPSHRLYIEQPNDVRALHVNLHESERAGRCAEITSFEADGEDFDVADFFEALFEERNTVDELGRG